MSAGGRPAARSVVTVTLALRAALAGEVHDLVQDGAQRDELGLLALRRLLAARQREQVADQLDEVVDAVVGAPIIGR